MSVESGSCKFVRLAAGDQVWRQRAARHAPTQGTQGTQQMEKVFWLCWRILAIPRCALTQKALAGGGALAC